VGRPWRCWKGWFSQDWQLYKISNEYCWRQRDNRRLPPDSLYEVEDAYTIGSRQLEDV